MIITQTQESRDQLKVGYSYSMHCTVVFGISHKGMFSSFWVVHRCTEQRIWRTLILNLTHVPNVWICVSFICDEQ